MLMQWRCTNCGCVQEADEKPHICNVCGSAHHMEGVDFSEKRMGKINREDIES